MLWMVGVVLVALWIVGAVLVPVAGGVLHLLLAAAVVVFVYRTLAGRRRVGW